MVVKHDSKPALEKKISIPGIQPASHQIIYFYQLS